MEFIGAYVPRELKARLQATATANHRSMNAQLEIFLAAGVAHPKATA